MATEHKKKKMRVAICLAMAVCLLVIQGGMHSQTQADPADIITVPTSLAPGDQYRLAFVTSATRDATSSDISVYNQFVDDLAESVPKLAVLNQDWKAIASTRTVHALTNTQTDPSPAGDTGVPIFLLDGTKLVDHYDDLWDGSLDTSLNVTETGASGIGTKWVWSGTSPAGTAYFPLGSDAPENGDRLLRGNKWTQAGRAGDGFSFHLYAMSGVMTKPLITVPTSLAPGDQYRLAFVTSATRDATSSDISVYNQFVDDLAESVPELAALNQDWKAIASTSAIDALTNTQTDPSPAGDTGVPIFLLDDTKLVDHYDDLWDGFLDTSLNVTETGASGIGTKWVWSGTSPAGTAYFPLGSDAPVNGDRLLRGNKWTQAGRAGDGFTFHLYAMSGVMTNPIPQAPVADADGPYIGDEGSPVVFDASGSYDPDGDELQYRWDLNNDGIWDTPYSTDPTTSFTWHDDYSGTVGLEVFDGELTDTATTEIAVYNVEPMALISAVVLTGEYIFPGNEVAFEGIFEDPGDLDEHSIEWFCSEEVMGAELVMTYAFDEAGEYIVTLRVIDDDGGVGEDSVPVIVLVPSEAVDDITGTVEDMELPQDLENSLTQTLESAISSLDKGNDQAAANKLQAFVNKVEAQRGKKKLTEEEADLLLSLAGEVIAYIEQ